ncbi:hypothetical protein N7522_002863 [Penicillium canescens]|uniref:Uncharacterized protein n=1 Tax=Penicillium canescens TaxID=5083 RepID=A0AAD6NCS0_PENCN|nr:uncharacterized protein N7446_007083 [Penicillium canescens]KAJ6012508.1 hypothetical protein N7522_002863 [Penicillium canescens]KAJ6049591.1 hypothetical protein N7444_006307 [Penicillium canescens]KAJ6052440.1 hypothetical protein N7460_002974 [Penicillium canescens]KAJ6062963.1 hypothetical protein N7446_007083 [Penicillium canescens]KAJ6182015.1 hypothetical protein N7485_000657 [Penicillium canescens]
MKYAAAKNETGELIVLWDGDEKDTSRVLCFTNLISADNIANNPVDDTRMLWPQTAAIFATNPRPESSKRFMSWFLGDECQQQFTDNGSYLSRKDLKGQTGSVWDDPYTPLTEFATFKENRELVEWWLPQFETPLCVAKDPSPVDSFYGKMHLNGDFKSGFKPSQALKLLTVLHFV